jgi:hypothetical protein
MLTWIAGRDQTVPAHSQWGILIARGDPETGVAIDSCVAALAAHPESGLRRKDGD